MSTTGCDPQNPNRPATALHGAIERVRLRLEAWARANAGMAEDTAAAPEEMAPVGNGEDDSPLVRLVTAFGLSAFERDVLVLATGVEVDARIATICREATGGGATFDLALAALDDPHWSALTPGGPLRRWRLIDLEAGGTLTRSPLRIEERVLHYLVGVAAPEERLSGLSMPVAPEGLSPSNEALAEKIARHFTEAETGAGALIELCGECASESRAVAALAAATLGLQLHVLRAGDLPGAAAECESFARLLEREAVLARTLWLIDAHGAEAAAMGRAAVLAQSLGCPAVVVAGEPLVPDRPSTLRIELSRACEPERFALWHSALGPLATILNGQLEAVVRHFPLGVPEIRATAARVRMAFDGEPTPDSAALGRALWAECRTQSRVRIEALAQRIESRTTWDDLIVGEPQRTTLREIAAHVRHRHRVYETWGFGAKSARGLGITALFAGPSGTGKTLAAEVLANELQLDLFRIDLSGVVSKYIGETEKNLARVFDAAERAGAILLFDEADSLFGKRSQVKDSHDRYANIEVGYLLQRMEAYRGLAILTTNARDALDPAFLRRLRFVVQFPLPDAGLREAIWRRMFPAEAPTEGIDTTQLARLSVAGGNIRNIALHAAFLAAEAGEPVRMAHLLRAARGECAKLERAVSGTEIGGWV